MKVRITQGGGQADINSLFANLEPRDTPLFESPEYFKAMDKIQALVNVRERAVKEVLSRLLDSGIDYDVATEAVDAAVRCGLIDEERYASSLIRGKTRQGWGRQKILNRLKEDGVSYESIDRCSSLFASPDDEYERAMKELSKRPARSKNPQATLTRRLLQKGYSYDLSVKAVADFMSSYKE